MVYLMLVAAEGFVNVDIFLAATFTTACGLLAVAPFVAVAVIDSWTTWPFWLG